MLLSRITVHVHATVHMIKGPEWLGRSMLKVLENTSPTSEANLRDYRASVFTNFEHATVHVHVEYLILLHVKPYIKSEKWPLYCILTIL